MGPWALSFSGRTARGKGLGFRVLGLGFRVQGVDDVWLQWHLATHAFGCGICVKSFLCMQWILQ